MVTRFYISASFNQQQQNQSESNNNSQNNFVFFPAGRIR